MAVYIYIGRFNLDGVPTVLINTARSPSWDGVVEGYIL